MAINILDESSISKLLAFLRVNAPAEFTVNAELLQTLLQKVNKFASEQGIKISVIAPSGGRKIVCSATGAIAGAAFGFGLAGLLGAGVGLVIGAAASYATAHLTLTIGHRPTTADGLVTVRLGAS